MKLSKVERKKVKKTTDFTDDREVVGGSPTTFLEINYGLNGLNGFFQQENSSTRFLNVKKLRISRFFVV